MNVQVTRLPSWESLRVLAGLVRDPMAMTRQLHARHGPFVLLKRPFSTDARPALICVADSELYATLHAAPDVWRGVNISFRGLRGSASQRLSSGMSRMRGARAEHYRRLIGPALRRPAVAALAPEMIAITCRQVEQWPRDVVFNLQTRTEDLMQRLAAGLLFGDDLDRAMPIARMITRQGHAARVIPGRDLLAWLRVAGQQERAILQWGEHKRGDLDAKDLLSLVVNNPDEHGRAPDAETIGGLTSFVFGAAFETCQQGLSWALLLLTQHPQVARRLTEETTAALVGTVPTLERIMSLPLLDAVVNESLRLFPPVPVSFRKSMAETLLGGVHVPPATRVLISGYLINRHALTYPQPHRFIPDRWLGDLRPSACEYTVFGAGPRMCPGFAFAVQAMKIALVIILSRHRVTVAPGARIGYRNRVTLAPHPGVPVILGDTAEPLKTERATGRFRLLVELPEVAT